MVQTGFVHDDNAGVFESGFVHKIVAGIVADLIKSYIARIRKVVGEKREFCSFSKFGCKRFGVIGNAAFGWRQGGEQGDAQGTQRTSSIKKKPMARPDLKSRGVRAGSRAKYASNLISPVAILMVQMTLSVWTGASAIVMVWAPA